MTDDLALQECHGSGGNAAGRTSRLHALRWKRGGYRAQLGRAGQPPDSDCRSPQAGKVMRAAANASSIARMCCCDWPGFLLARKCGSSVAKSLRTERQGSAASIQGYERADRALMGTESLSALYNILHLMITTLQMSIQSAVANQFGSLFAAREMTYGVQNHNG